MTETTWDDVKEYIQRKSDNAVNEYKKKVMKAIDREANNSSHPSQGYPSWAKSLKEALE